jgi:membrane protein required for colicin V production
MNKVDLVLVAVLALFALRGYWRGFFRESFGLLALLSGIAVALRFSSAAASLLEPYVGEPAVREAIAFIAIFVGTHGVVNLVGVLLDHLAGPTLIARAAGVVVAIGKGAALSGVVLLFLHLFPLVPSFDAELMQSRLAAPLVGVAGDVLRFGITAEAAAKAPSHP